MNDIIFAQLVTRQIDILRIAQAFEIPVVIDGDRTQPTGKSTLCRDLRDRGFNVNRAMGTGRRREKAGHLAKRHLHGYPA